MLYHPRREVTDPELVTYLDRRFTEIDRRFSEQSTDLRQALAAQSKRLREEMDRQFREVHVLIEGLGGQIELVSEGVSANYEAHQRLRVEMDRRFDDVDSFLRLPFDAAASRRGSTDSN